MTIHHHNEPAIRRKNDARVTVWPYLMRIALLLVMLAGTGWLQWACWFAPQDYPSTVLFYATRWERLTMTGMSVFCVCANAMLVTLSHRRITRALNAPLHQGEAE